MSSYIYVILLTVVLFLAMVVSLSAKPKFITKLSTILAILVGISGFIFYGYGYDYVCESKTIAIIKAIMAVSKIYVGYNALGDISAAPIFSNTNVLIYFYLIHFLGFYASASATITKLGSGIIRRFKLWLLRFNDIVLIYGCDENTLQFADELYKSGYKSILFVDNNFENSDKYVIRNDQDALNGNVDFLHSIGLKGNNRRIYVYALKDTVKNMQYAMNLKKSLEICQISSNLTRIVLFSVDKSLGVHLLNNGNRYGFGDVVILNQQELAARLLIQKYPCYSVMGFDGNGKATNDFDCLIVGFGKMGQEVLKKLVMNGQFEGSHFHAMVVSLDHDKMNGFISNISKRMFEKYDIEFMDEDIRSKTVYNYIQSHINTLNYVVICTGDEKLNHEISEEITSYCHLHNNSSIIVQCSKNGILHMNQEFDCYERYPLYIEDVLADETIDEMAMLLNHAYCKGNSVEEDWKNCDYFSRMSCRASADYIGAIISASGLNEKEIIHKGFDLSKTMMENLGKHEHLRWCAFHYAMGFEEMSDEELNYRGLCYKNGEKIRICKDMENRRHACLRDWNDLDELSKKEYEFTGIRVDYKKKDIDNILMIPKLIGQNKKLS